MSGGRRAHVDAESRGTQRLGDSRMGGSDLHGGKVREASESLGIPGHELLDFSANINFLGPSPRVVEAARRAVDEIGWYPLDPPEPLRRAAARFLGVPVERVLLGNGGSELIFLTVAHLRPRRVAVLGPTFTEYERAARAWGAMVDLILAPPAVDFAYSAAHIRTLAPRLEDADLVFFCDPNNPTGALWDREARAALVDICGRAGTIVFSDESFMAFTADWPGGALSTAAPDHVVVLHSLTKILALPGLRVGALVVPSAVANELGPRLPPWNINCVAQSAALAGLADADLVGRTPQAVAEARKALVAELRDTAGVERVLAADGNFLCLRLVAPARVVASRMLHEHGILVRDLTDLPGMATHWMRVAVREQAENSRLVAALAAVLGSVGSDNVGPAGPEVPTQRDSATRTETVGADGPRGGRR
jgi:threonine-phosphate decarboxylase